MSKKVGEAWITKHAWFQVCVYCKNLNGQRGKHRRQSFAFAYYGISFGKANDFLGVYRKRFGIELSAIASSEDSDLYPQAVVTIILFCVANADAE